MSLRLLAPAFLRGRIPQGQGKAGEGDGPQGTRVALTFVLPVFHTHGVGNPWREKERRGYLPRNLEGNSHPPLAFVTPYYPLLPPHRWKNLLTGGLEPKTQPYLDVPSPNYLSLHVLPDRSFNTPRLPVCQGPPSLSRPLIPVSSSLGDTETCWLLLERIPRRTCATSL